MPNYIRCPICGKDKRGKVKYHMMTFHPEIPWDEEGRLFYFKYYHTMEDPNCQYCGRPRKMLNWTFCYDTCGSKECKSKFSSKGARSQIESEGKELWVEKRIIHRHKMFPGLDKEIAVKMNRTLNSRRVITGFSTPQEERLFNRLKSENLDFIYQDYRFYHSHSKRFNLNCIMDFSFPDSKLCVEVDGLRHENPEIKLRDLKNDELKGQAGWKTLRFTNSEVDNDLDTVIAKIKDNL